MLLKCSQTPEAAICANEVVVWSSTISSPRYAILYPFPLFSLYSFTNTIIEMYYIEFKCRLNLVKTRTKLGSKNTSAPIKEFILSHSYLFVDLGDDLDMPFFYGGLISVVEEVLFTIVDIELKSYDDHLNAIHMGNEICEKDLILALVGISTYNAVTLEVVLNHLTTFPSPSHIFEPTLP